MAAKIMRGRYVLYYEFETRGIFTGYVDGHFGQQATQSASWLRLGWSCHSVPFVHLGDVKELLKLRFSHLRRIKSRMEPVESMILRDALSSFWIYAMVS